MQSVTSPNKNCWCQVIGTIIRSLLRSQDAPGIKCDDTRLKNSLLFFVLEFDQQVQESKYKAEDAQATVPEIRQLIADAQNKTANARQALIGAEHNAQIARDSAQEAQQKYAERASQVCP